MGAVACAAKDETFQIINAHEHVQNIEVVPKYLKAMEENGIVKTVLLGSSEATLYSGHTGFDAWEKNNEEILEIAKAYPGRFIVFPTIDVRDPAKLEKLKDYLARGGKGLKLYSGHTIFHDRPLDDPSMLPVYATCEKNKVPILFHVNAGYYEQEFERVLLKFPQLKVICPHFCLSTIKTVRFEYLMDTYPQLYTDISFGFIGYLQDALLRFSRNPEKYRQLIIKYQDRILFGTDMVVTDANYKTTEWLASVTRGYRDVLEKETYAFFGVEFKTLKGLRLDKKVLEKIYSKNFERFFGKDS